MNSKPDSDSSRVWVFAQSDRAQREIYVEELKKIGAEKYTGEELEWKNMEEFNSCDQVDRLAKEHLVLFDLDELTVNYGYAI